MLETEALKAWLSISQGPVEEDDNIGLMHGIIVCDDNSMELIAFDLSPDQIWQTVMRRIAELNCREVVFGIDRYALPNQGVEASSLVTVYHWIRERDTKYGWETAVLPYDYAHGVLPLDWNCTHWKNIQEAEIESFFKATQNKTEQLLKKLGIRKEQVENLKKELLNLGRAPTMEEVLAAVKKAQEEVG